MANGDGWKKQPRVPKGKPDGGQWAKLEGIYNSDSELGRDALISNTTLSIKINSALDNRRMSNGGRRSAYHILTDDEILFVKQEAKALNIPERILRFNEGRTTSFIDGKKLICIRGNIFPDPDSIYLRDRLSVRAVLAHEYYGHYKHSPSKFVANDWRDEFEASYCAAIDAPGLSPEDRRMLMLDAYDRAKEAGVKIYYNNIARRLIYGEND